MKILRRRLFRATLLAVLIAGAATAENGIPDNPLADLSLEDLMNVTITASRRTQSIADAPSTVYVITAEEIERFGFVDLKDALKLVPGMIVEDASYGQLYGGQRGFTGTFNKTLIMINGREVNNLLAGEAFIGPQFPLHNVKRIEVVAGPGSALYGANAFAGVINIITRTPSDDGANNLAYSYGANTTNLATMGLGRRFENSDLTVAARYKVSDGADFSDYVSDLSRFNAAVFRGANGWSRLADGRYYNATTGQVFRTPKTHGDRFENPEEASFLDLTYVHRFDGEGALTPDEVFAGVDYYDMTTGHGLSKTQQLYYTGTDHREFLMAWLGGAKRFFENRLEARTEFRFTRERTWGNHTAVDRIPNYPDTLGAVPGGNPYGYPSADDDSNPATPYSPSLGQIEKMRGHWSNKHSPGSRRYFGEMQVSWEGDFAGVPILNSLTGFGARPHHLIMGLAVDRKEATTNPWSLAWPSGVWNSVYLADHPPLSDFDRRPALSSTKYGVYFQDQVGFWDDRVLLTAGVRYDHHRNDGGDYFSYGGILNPRAGLNIRVTPEDTLKILYGKAFREATPFEDPGLRPERMTTYELGWIRQVERLALTNQVNLYFNRATNYIINEPQRFPDGRVAYGYTNGGILEVFGLEEVLHWEPTTRTTLDLSYTYQDPWIHQRTGTNPGNPVEKFRLHPVPRHQANARVHWNPVDRIGLGWVTRWSARVRNFDDPSQYGANANPIAYIPAYAVHDATATIRLGKTAAVDDGFRLTLTVQNLFDKFYEHSNNRFTGAFMENPTAFAQPGRSWTLKIDTRF